jgi:hypothetical protein
MDGIELVYGVGAVVSDAVAYLIVLGLIVNFFAFVLFTAEPAGAGNRRQGGYLSSLHAGAVHGAPSMASMLFDYSCYQHLCVLLRRDTERKTFL